MVRQATLLVFLLGVIYGCASQVPGDSAPGGQVTDSDELNVRFDEDSESILIFRGDQEEPVLTHNAREDFRPYIHPIIAPDGQGELTEFSPGHHTHQTGLYWGFTNVNGRDFFHNPEGDHWRRVSAGIIEADNHHNHHGEGHNPYHNHDHDEQTPPESGEIGGEKIYWQTIYDMLDADGNPLMRETQNWSMWEENGEFILDLEWQGEANTDITVGESEYGGLFLRMPWKEGIHTEVVNAVRDQNERAEGQRAMWLNIGMQVEGRDDLANIALFDHSDNNGYPTPWRVDGQFGIGPSRAIMGDWTIAEGETEIIRYRIKIYTDEFQDLALTSAWEDYVEDHGTYSTAAMWGIARQAGREAEFLTPDEAAANSTLLDGFNVTAWVGEPKITTPMAFTWDDRGRLWVAENNDYETRGTGFSAAGDSRILILEDTNADGYADSRTVFMEGIAFPAAMAVGFDGLYLGAPPNLLFVPIGDYDTADLDNIEVLLTGWGIDDRHETINSLHWGPDGWLYGLQGLFTHSNVGHPKPGAKRVYTHNDPFPESLEDLLDGEGVEINGGIWRYHPTKDRFEVVAHGLSNPWGIDHNAKGQLFVTACVIPHLWHIIPGGVYHRQGGSHFNPYIYNDIKTIADHRHRSAHGGASIYLSDAFPEEHFGRIFMANIHEHAVLSDVMERAGSGFTAHHGDDFMLANNAAWVGFSTEIGPDGGLYILDWHDRDICGTEVLNEDTGRIFKIMPDESLADEWEGRYDDVSAMSDEQLVDLQSRNSAWHARRARVNLQYRASKGELQHGTIDQLRTMFETESNPDWRLRAMWALHVTGGISQIDLIDLLEDEDEYVRGWAIQLISEDFSLTTGLGSDATVFSNWGIQRPSEVQIPSGLLLDKFQQMALEDDSPVVRLYLASALHRLDPEHRWEIIGQLMMHEEDVDDHNIPGMIWFAFEPLVKENTERALALAGQSEIPMIARYAARRAIEADGLEALVDAVGNESKRQISLLEGLRDGLEGRGSDVTAPSNWSEVYEKLQQSTGRVPELALDVAQQLGDLGASLQFFTVLQNADAPVEDRREAIRRLSLEQYADLSELIPDLLNEPDLRTEAIWAVAGFDEPHLGEVLMERYDEFTIAEKSEVIRTMASRPTYGRILTRALEDDEISRRDVPVDVARQLQRVVGVGFVDVWGPIADEGTADEIAYTHYRELLTNEAVSNADVQKGRVVYNRTCGPCHQLYGEGGEIGPDLTGSNRANLDYLLRMVINPNEIIQDAYRLVVVTTQDGRTYSGNVIGESERQLTLRVVGLDEVVINKSDIQTREQTEVSLMPPRLFDALSEEEVIDLVAYLRTTSQVELPEGE